MAKKDFTADTGRVSSSFISNKTPLTAQPEQEQEEQPATTEQPEQKAIYRRKDIKFETKSRRMDILVYPSTYNELKRRADAATTEDGKKVTVNDYLNTILIKLLFEEDV